MTRFEIRVEGVLAAPTLHHLGCVASVAGAQTVLRIEATPSGLQELVRRCSRRGRPIESIIRVPAGDQRTSAPGCASQHRPS